jgi:hypothetical protein
MKGMTMCSPWAYESWLEYAAVFPEIADLLNASGVKARVKDNADKTGFLVKVTLPNRTVAVLSEDGEHWSVNLSGKVITLDIPVENRDATAIVAAVLKAIGK